MDRIQGFGEVQSAAVTVVVDNRADLMLRSTETVEYFTGAALLAEHGFSAVVDLRGAGIRILWDAGVTSISLLENMKRMEIEPATIDKIALSHGHGDHTAGVSGVLKAMAIEPGARRWGPDATPEKICDSARWRRVPLVAHPAAFRERWYSNDDGTKYGPILPPPRGEWEALGAEIVLSEGPHQLGPGCWVTGVVPRRSFEQSGIPRALVYRQGDEFIRDEVEDDQAIVINVKNKGLVILSGCAHSGIVNTVEYGREISGVDRVWAIIGGFHLAAATDEEIQQTIDEIKKLGPVMVAPSHCTGFRAMCKFVARMPEEFVSGVVGTTHLF